MNPLDLRGPEFLLFYLVYGVALLGAAWLLRRAWSEPPSVALAGRFVPGHYPRESEAYHIALLRGGPLEAARTLVGRLLAADLLVLDNGVLRPSSEPPKESSPLAPIEAEALAAAAALTPGPSPGGRGESFGTRDTVSRIAQALSLQMQQMREELEREGLLPGADQRRKCRALFLLTLAAVPGLGAAKLLVALSRGRTNIGFLILLLIVCTLLVVLFLGPPQRTRSGDRYLAWLRDSHRGLRSLLASGRRAGQGEMALAAGIYGPAALPALSPLDMTLDHPKKREPGAGASSAGHGCGSGDASSFDGGSGDSGGSGGDSGGGDSGGSSCGSSCGGGCGGGGCGGCGGG